MREEVVAGCYQLPELSALYMHSRWWRRYRRIYQWEAGGKKVDKSRCDGSGVSNKQYAGYFIAGMSE